MHIRSQLRCRRKWVCRCAGVVAVLCIVKGKVEQSIDSFEVLKQRVKSSEVLGVRYGG